MQSALYIDDDSGNTGTRNTVNVIQNNAAALAATALAVQSDGGITGMTLDKNFTDVAAATVTGLHVDFDRTVPGSGTATFTDIGINLDVNAAGLGTTTTTGLDIDVVGATSGTHTAVGLDVTVGSADTNYAALFSGGNVGIGIATPAAELDIAGSGGSDGAAGSPTLRLSNTVDTTDWDSNDVIGTIEYYAHDVSGNAPYVSSFIKNMADTSSTTMPFGGLAFGVSNEDAAATEQMRLNYKGALGIGTTTIPHGGIGGAKLALEGAQYDGTYGPHIQCTTAADDYPLFQMLNWSHDNITMAFDSYYQGAWKSSDVGSNFAMSKGSDSFKIRYDSGIAAGSSLTWNDGVTLDTSGNVTIGNNLKVGGNVIQASDGGTTITMDTDDNVTAGGALTATTTVTATTGLITNGYTSLEPVEVNNSGAGPSGTDNLSLSKTIVCLNHTSSTAHNYRLPSASGVAQMFFIFKNISGGTITIIPNNSGTLGSGSDVLDGGSSIAHPLVTAPNVITLTTMQSITLMAYTDGQFGAASGTHGLNGTEGWISLPAA